MSGLLAEIKACRICADKFNHEPRPVLQFNSSAKILIAGQAPGGKVHESGIPFDDASGDRLREWMGIDKRQFYNSNQIAIAPMAFCYPGTGKSGDLAPPPICAQTWRKQLLSQLKCVELTLLVGQYAMAYHLPEIESTLTETVQAWQDYWPSVLPMPHPSPRNNIWLKQNPWFSEEVLPRLRERVAGLIA